MKMHRFEGATMRDAIAKVKAELGDQAVIISTRQVRKGLLGTAVEISAAIDNDDDEQGDFQSLHGPSTGGPARSAYAAQAQPPTPTPAAPKGPDVDKLGESLRSEMRSLRAMVRSQSSQSSETRATSELRTEVAALKKLLEAKLEGSSAPTKVSVPAIPALPKKLTPTKAAPTPVIVRGSTSSLVMLVGPTGAGKTTTIAKLAATAALVEGRTVRIVTLDNYRVGGVEQIRQFADLIGAPLVVLETPHALAELMADDDGEYELTLVDTAGTSPRDLSSIHALQSVLAMLPDLEVHLVIPATSSAAHIDELAARFAPLEPARLLFTKLDEVDAIPELTRAPARLGIPLTYVTTGQAVPEDLEEPTVVRVHELAARGLGPIGAVSTNPGHAARTSRVA